MFDRVSLLTALTVLTMALPGNARPLYRRATGIVLAAALAPAEKKAPDAPEGQVLLLKLKAKGVQIYECRAKKEKPTEFEWVLTAPEAVLLDENDKVVGRHYGGPSWESMDKSKVVAALPPVTATPKPGAVAELLLKTKATEGKGVFSSVTIIRRVETVGGVAPLAPGAAYLGTELRVPYRATYLFYGPKP